MSQGVWTTYCPDRARQNCLLTIPATPLADQEIFEEYPPKADLRKELSKPLPFIAPGTVPPISAEETTQIAVGFLDEFNAALASNDAQKLAGLFHAGQAYWRDLVALTSHIRNFDGSSKIAPALLETRALRASSDPLQFIMAMFVAPTPVLVRK